MQVPACPDCRADPAWLRAGVTTLATAVYEGRAFEDLPVRADALEDAGCARAEILEHCRSGGPHALGCWVLGRAVSGGVIPSV